MDRYRAISLKMLSCDHAAIVDLNGVVMREPANARAHIDRGSVRRFLGDYQGAIKDFTQGIALDPMHLSGRRSNRSALDLRANVDAH